MTTYWIPSLYKCPILSENVISYYFVSKIYKSSVPLFFVDFKKRRISKYSFECSVVNAVCDAYINLYNVSLFEFYSCLHKFFIVPRDMHRYAVLYKQPKQPSSSNRWSWLLGKPSYDWVSWRGKSVCFSAQILSLIWNFSTKCFTEEFSLKSNFRFQFFHQKLCIFILKLCIQIK